MMKKKKLKSLKLNKVEISNLQSNNVLGGTVITFGAICTGVAASYVFDCFGTGQSCDCSGHRYCDTQHTTGDEGELPPPPPPPPQ